MTPRTALTLGLSALRSVRYLLAGRIRFPQERLGDVLETPDGDAFVVYRETALRPIAEDPFEGGVVLVFRMRTSGRTVGERLRDVLFDPLANVATPFFAGMPGFRRKLWLAGERPGEFLELYEWATAADADRFVAALESLLAPVDFAGSASFEMIAEDTIDEYVATHAVSWRDVARRRRRGRRRRAAGLVLAAAVASIAAYLAWRRRSRP